MILVSILLLTSCDFNVSDLLGGNSQDGSIIVDTNTNPDNSDKPNGNPSNNNSDNNQTEDNKPNDNNTDVNNPSDDNTEIKHSYTATVTPPTCKDQGYTTYTCSDCGDTYIANYVAIIAHTWQDATTEAPKTCTVCGATEGEKLPTLLDTLSVHYINVGQGDSIFIKIGDCDILIDAGEANKGKTVSNYLKNQGVDDIELMVNTHPHADHCGGLTQVLNDHVVEEVWISKNTSATSKAYTNFISAISNEGLTAKKPDAGTVYTYEYVTLTVLYNENIKSDINNSSIVIMLEYGSTRFLFTGDIEKEAEAALVQAKADLKCDVLKVAHHGSAGSSNADFLKAAGAEYGVICVGKNTYGHPTSAALDRLNAAGTTVYRTDLLGHIVFSTNGITLTIPS